MVKKSEEENKLTIEIILKFYEVTEIKTNLSTGKKIICVSASPLISTTCK